MLQTLLSKCEQTLTSNLTNNQAQASQQRLIELDRFPFEFLSTLAERESWRKEIYRPVYHVHKWWAKRLGSVFRGILLGCLLDSDDDLATAFYRKNPISTTTVFDPFMGGGTTLGEAHKLGLIAVGRDINPVACETVRIALQALNKKGLQQGFVTLSESVGEKIKALYRAENDEHTLCDVLYYFWVKIVLCPHCSGEVNLFSSYIFAKNADPVRKPKVQVYCPDCGDVFSACNTDKSVLCHCGHEFNPHRGPAGHSNAICRHCGNSFSILSAVRRQNKPPAHRLYAKLLLTPAGKKQYVRATEQDVLAYTKCTSLLQHEIEWDAIQLPRGELAAGNNTSQAINYNYRSWRDFFNDRQLLALGWLQAAIAQLPSIAERDAFLLLFSGLLEFNNVFASYKGEGTGAVRHMFSHHILKPERMPIEANVWGTAKSSGSLLNLYKSRLLRASDYQASPFEIAAGGAGKQYGISWPLGDGVTTQWPTDGVYTPTSIYLSCGSSSHTELQSKSVDLVVTDPPFFDNVHYSELADFFFAWQKLLPRGFVTDQPTTRNIKEVQDAGAAEFSSKLQAVLVECHRVLKEEGLLVFTYHHARPEGWTALQEAVVNAKFTFVNAHPVKAELSVATPKSQSQEPIQIDIILVCRKAAARVEETVDANLLLQATLNVTKAKLRRLKSTGLTLSKGDCQVAFMSQLLVALGTAAEPKESITLLHSFHTAAEKLLEPLYRELTYPVTMPAMPTAVVSGPTQIAAF